MMRAGDQNVVLAKDTKMRKKKIHAKVIPHLGILYGATSGFFYSLCSAIVKHLNYLSPSQLATFRFIGMFLPTLAASFWLRQSIFPKQHRLNIIGRSFFGCVALLLQFYAYQNLPLGDASVIVFSLPVFVPVFARIFLKEICSLMTFFTSVVAVCGVVLIIQPTFIFGELAQQDSTLGSVAAVCSLIIASLVFIMIRKLEELHFCIIMLDFSIFSIILTLILTASTKSFQLPSCGWDMLLLYAIAFFSFTGQIFFTKALQIEAAAIVAICRTTDIVFALLWQILWFEERPNFLKIIGISVVTTCIIITGIQKHFSSLPEDSEFKKKIGFLIRDRTGLGSHN